MEHLNDPFSHLLKLSKLIDIKGHFVIEGPIEENNNLIYHSSKFIGKLKKLLEKKIVLNLIILSDLIIFLSKIF